MSVQKRKSNQNQPTKQKQTNKKQQRQQFFRHKKFWQGENWLFCALIFFVRSKSFRKKNRLAWSCLDSFIYNTTETSQKLSSLWASHCSDFEQVKKLFFWLWTSQKLTWTSQKLTIFAGFKKLTSYFAGFEQVKSSFRRNSVTYGTPCHAIDHFIFWCHHVTYRAPCHASGHLVIYRQCYGSERAFFTLRRFLPYTPSCWF